MRSNLAQQRDRFFTAPHSRAEFSVAARAKRHNGQIELPDSAHVARLPEAVP